MAARSKDNGITDLAIDLLIIAVINISGRS